MEKQILVPLDYSEISRNVLKFADEWGQRTGANLHLLHVEPRSIQKADHDQWDFLEKFNAYLQQSNLSSKHQVSVRIGTSYLEILDYAESMKIDLILMAAHSHTAVGRLFLGSNTDYVLHHCHCPVYVYKQPDLAYENNILVPIDYSGVNKIVIEKADTWAQQTNAKLYFIHAAYLPEKVGEFTAAAGTGVNIKMFQPPAKMFSLNEREREFDNLHQYFDEYVAALRIKSPYESFFEIGKPYLKIKDRQHQIKARLIMMAAHSHILLNRLFVGSNTDYLLHHLNCSMYVYKE